MPFKKYMHVERLGADEVDDLLFGTVLVQPKIDGTNASIWCEWVNGFDGVYGEMHFGSRNQEIVGDNDHMGFVSWCKDNSSTLSHLFMTRPSWRLYGEFLVPHSLKTYRDDAWRKFYVFDVYDDSTESFVPYDEYQSVLSVFHIDCIPVIATMTNPSVESLQKLMDRNTFLIKDGEGLGEGIVIKRYDFKNKYGHTVWAKIVRNEFKEVNLAAFGPPEVKSTIPDGLRFIQEFVTRGRIEKTINTIQPWSSKRIPELFGRVWHELITTELWDWLKARKYNATIDFNETYKQMIAQIKSVYPELF